jgi:CRISPR-associated protein Cas2
MIVIVSYDIIDDKQRTRLAKKLLNFGQRVQYSVFECNLNKDQFGEMKKQALKLVDLDKDSLRIYRLCDSCRKHIESYGIKKGWEDLEDDEVIVV